MGLAVICQKSELEVVFQVVSSQDVVRLVTTLAQKARVAVELVCPLDSCSWIVHHAKCDGFFVYVSFLRAILELD